jgi:hypothetical protein
MFLLYLYTRNFEFYYRMQICLYHFMCTFILNFRYCNNYYHIHHLNAVILLTSKILLVIFAINLCISQNFGIQTLCDRDHIHVYGF